MRHIDTSERNGVAASRARGTRQSMSFHVRADVGATEFEAVLLTWSVHTH